MPLEPGQVALLRPAAVAVHDDADVAWQRCSGHWEYREQIPRQRRE
jgi:hypothetical protein